MKAAALADHRAQDGPRAADHTDRPSIPENQRGPSSSAPTRTGAISSVTAATARCTLSLQSNSWRATADATLINELPLRDDA
jgi:hypothetical protein